MAPRKNQKKPADAPAPVPPGDLPLLPPVPAVVTPVSENPAATAPEPPPAPAPDLDEPAPSGDEPEPESEASGAGGRGDVPHGTGLAELGEGGPSQLRGMMSQYFMEYASYVIKDRAIPDIDDGLKPVQRRILHALFEADDGKFHKVANIVGNTMHFHPHGDASIYSALVTLANKEYFLDKQGNYGNILTGDPPAAARYIECRLSPLAREVLFNPEITAFVDSYDGRHKEPISLPAKVPVLLMQGSDGIAVGMATRILSHNFRELLEAQIAILRGESFMLYPDFLQGGSMDVSEYQDGNGKVRVRAKIETVNHKTLTIRDVPPTTTTESLIASIEAANERGKIKLSAINDYTAKEVEIELTLTRGVDAERTLKALYAYTDCEVSIAVNCLVIENHRPAIKSVSEILRHNTAKLQRDLQRELELELGHLDDQFHAKTLAQLFVEHRLYKKIEECPTQDEVFKAVHAGFVPFRPQLTRDVTDEDVEKLLQIPIRRISLFDMNKNRREMDEILARMNVIREHLGQMRRFTIDFLKALLKKYGQLYPRRTRVENMEEVDVRAIALSNLKVGLDRGSGYLGTDIKTDTPLLCTEFDRLVVLRTDGSYKVIQVPDKLYVGPVCEVFKADRNQVYSLIYRDRKTRVCFVKRFKIESYIMEKEYRCLPEGAKIEKIFDRHGVVLRCEFEPSKRHRESFVDVDFTEVAMRGASAKGSKVHERVISRMLQVKRGSDLAPEDPNAPPASSAPAASPAPPAASQAVTPAPEPAAKATPASSPPPPPPLIPPAPKSARPPPAPAKPRPPPAGASDESLTLDP